MLRVIDRDFKNHLLSIDHLREGIGLRGYAQVDPLLEYKRESYEMFQQLTASIAQSSVYYVMTFSAVPREQAARRPRPAIARQVKPSQPQPPAAQKQPIKVKRSGKIGRNDPCPCGSGKKYKKCCGRDVKPVE